MVDMNSVKPIPVWEGCDPVVEAAVRQFQKRWQPYSVSSRRYPIIRLIEELIDPAVAAYTATLPYRYLGHLPGAGTGVRLSGIIRMVGFDAAARLQRELLRNFIRQEDHINAQDKRFAATLESVFELIWASACKQSVDSQLCDSNGNPRGLNGRRRQGFCRFCGNPTSLTSFTDDESQLRGVADESRLSTLYCKDHQPKLASAAWNPNYRKVRRSVDQFDIELARLSRQCAKRSSMRAAESGDELVDGYFYHYFLSQTIQPADAAELRNLARLMVDAKLSDAKKKMLVLQLSGLNQSEVAERLLGSKQQPLTRQAVSKALASIPAIFHLTKRKKRPSC